MILAPFLSLNSSCAIASSILIPLICRKVAKGFFFSPFLLSVQMQISTHIHRFKRQNLTGSSIIYKVHHLSLQLHSSLMKPFICVNVPTPKLTSFARYHILSLLYLICRLLWWISCSRRRKSSVQRSTALLSISQCDVKTSRCPILEGPNVVVILKVKS